MTMKNILTLAILLSVITANAQSTWRREINTTSQFSREAFTNETAAQWRAKLGVGAGGGGTGTLASVSLTMPFPFIVTGSPLVADGTISVALPAQSGNTVFAAPDGITGTPSFRALTSADIPSLAASKITSGQFSQARLGIGSADASTWLRGDGTWAALPSSGSVTSQDVTNAVLAFSKTNVFHVDDYGAIGNGVAVDDIAFSNCWRAAWYAGGIFSTEGKGKTYVISNFVFSSVASSPLIINFGAPIYRGAGSVILHRGTNYLMRFTNTCPDIYCLNAYGNGNSAGGIFISGPPSNGKLIGANFYGYTNGTAVMAEGLTNWKVQAWAAYCYRGFGFGAYCDASQFDLRGDHCSLLVDSAVTNTAFQYTTQGPVGGTWNIVGNYCGDVVLCPARGVLNANVTLESMTNAYVTFGHNLARHGYDNTAQGAGVLNLHLSAGFGNPANGGIVPANWTNAPVELNCQGVVFGRGQLYGTGYTNAMFLSRNSQADACTIEWNGASSAFAMPNLIQFSTGERMKYRNNQMTTFINQPLRVVQFDQGSLNVNHEIPVLGVMTKSASLAPDVAKIGYAVDDAGTNFAGGIRVWYAGGAQVQITNAPLEVRSPATFTSTIAAQGVITAGIGGGVPGPGGTLIDVTGLGQTAVDIRNGQGELQLTVYGYDAYVGNRSNAKLYLQSNNQTRWQITAAGDLLPQNDFTYDLGSVTSQVRTGWFSMLRATNIIASNNIVSFGGYSGGANVNGSNFFFIPPTNAPVSGVANVAVSTGVENNTNVWTKWVAGPQVALTNVVFTNTWAAVNNRLVTNYFAFTTPRTGMYEVSFTYGTPTEGGGTAIDSSSYTTLKWTEPINGTVQSSDSFDSRTPLAGYNKWEYDKSYRVWAKSGTLLVVSNYMQDSFDGGGDTKSTNFVFASVVGTP